MATMQKAITEIYNWLRHEGYNVYEGKIIAEEVSKLMDKAMEKKVEIQKKRLEDVK